MAERERFELSRSTPTGFAGRGPRRLKTAPPSAPLMSASRVRAALCLRNEKGPARSPFPYVAERERFELSDLTPTGFAGRGPRRLKTAPPSAPLMSASRVRAALCLRNEKGPARSPFPYVAERERFELSDLTPTGFAGRGPRRLKTAPPSAPLMSVSRVRATLCLRNEKGPARSPFPYVAERERFELSRRSSRLPAFEAGAFNRSTTSPYARPWLPGQPLL